MSRARAAAVDRLRGRRWSAQAPPLARPHLESIGARPRSRGWRNFEILASEAAEGADIHLPPDLFCCEECLAEMATPGERRHRYPFTNCTQCGPRYTIISALPYDRPATSMAGFAMCAACRAEYENPADRRFHAQPLACPDCGPKLTFHGAGHSHAEGEAALDADGRRAARAAASSRSRASAAII